MDSFSPAQKESLREMLATPLFQAALQNALADVLSGYSGAETQETCALSYKAQEGAKLLVSTLYASVDAKKVVAPTHRRFRPEPIIG